MERSFPTELDKSVEGISVTFWTDPNHKWLLQHSTTDSLPCFAQIDGDRRRIQPAFDPQQLYAKCLGCILANAVSQAKPTEYPSIDIGIAYNTLKIYSNVPLTSDSLKDKNTRELRDYLVSVIGGAS